MEVKDSGKRLLFGKILLVFSGVLAFPSFIYFLTRSQDLLQEMKSEYAYITSMPPLTLPLIILLLISSLLFLESLIVYNSKKGNTVKKLAVIVLVQIISNLLLLIQCSGRAGRFC